MSERPEYGLALTGLAALSVWIGALFFASGLDAAAWLPAILGRREGDIAALLFTQTFLPRSAVGFLAGSALGLAGAIMQQTLRNPLASPSTLGVTAGAQLALALALLGMPSLVGWGRPLVAMGGGAVAVGAVLLLSRRSGFAPVTVLLSGVVVALLSGTLAAALVLFNEHSLGGLFIWGSGSLVQDGWDASRQLFIAILAVVAVLVAGRRAFLLLILGEEAGALGFSVVRARLLFLCLSVVLTGIVTGQLGMIGFVGLAAPALCRSLGYRTPLAIALASMPAGGFLLSATDNILQILDVTAGISLPAGAVTALFGGPLLIALVRRMRGFPLPAIRSGGTPSHPRPLFLIAGVMLLIPLLAGLSLTFNVLPDGHFGFPTPDMLWELLPWRWPRVVASLAAGALLACSGLLLQRLTGNPAASPEILGVSAGAALGLAVAVFWVPAPSYGVQLAATALGSGSVLALLLFLALRAPASSEVLLLMGIALGAFVSALLAILMASGDPRMMLIANWMAGSTYDVEPELAIGLCVALAGLLALGFACFRWLDMLPLGQSVAIAAGVPVPMARLLLLALSACMAGAATLAVGPLSFIGLMAPHLASRMRLMRAWPQLCGAALAGAVIMVFADWLGRNLWFPFQIPAGLLASLIGSPALVWLLAKSQGGNK